MTPNQIVQVTQYCKSKDLTEYIGIEGVEAVYDLLVERKGGAMREEYMKKLIENVELLAYPKDAFGEYRCPWRRMTNVVSEVFKAIKESGYFCVTCGKPGKFDFDKCGVCKIK